MNARGKALTDFENFKARFEKHIKEKKFEKDLSLTEANKVHWKELTEKTFSHKIDTVWTDLFWKHRGNDNLVDNEFIKFIAGIAINSYAENQEIFDKTHTGNASQPNFPPHQNPLLVNQREKKNDSTDQ